MTTLSAFRPIILIAFLVVLTTKSNAQEVLTNQDLIQLAKMGMGDAIILSKVKNANNDYDASTAGLMALKASGIGDDVIAEVINATNDPTRKVVDANDPLAPHRPGVYYADTDGGLKELMPNVVNQGNTKNIFTNAISKGWAKVTNVARLTGANSRTQFMTEPTFYFYFNQQTNMFDPSTIGFYGFLQATSPNEFTLTALQQYPDARELEVGSSNNLSSESGINTKHIREFSIEKVADGIYKVTPTVLASGEYCFVYGGQSGHEAQKVFDFGMK